MSEGLLSVRVTLKAKTASEAIEIATRKVNRAVKLATLTPYGTVRQLLREYGVPRKLKCSRCQQGDHCNGDDDDCYCECTEARI